MHVSEFFLIGGLASQKTPGPVRHMAAALTPAAFRVSRRWYEVSINVLDCLWAKHFAATRSPTLVTLIKQVLCCPCHSSGIFTGRMNTMPHEDP
jgi:hypothetical protein